MFLILTMAAQAGPPPLVATTDMAVPEPSLDGLCTSVPVRPDRCRVLEGNGAPSLAEVGPQTTVLLLGEHDELGPVAISETPDPWPERPARPLEVLASVVADRTGRHLDDVRASPTRGLADRSRPFDWIELGYATAGLTGLRFALESADSVEIAYAVVSSERVVLLTCRAPTDSEARADAWLKSIVDTIAGARVSVHDAQLVAPPPRRGLDPSAPPTPTQRTMSTHSTAPPRSARLESRVAPEVPDDALRFGLGLESCTTRVDVAATGVPLLVEVEGCDPVLHPPVRAAVAQWRWTATTQAHEVTYGLRFDL